MVGVNVMNTKKVKRQMSLALWSALALMIQAEPLYSTDDNKELLELKQRMTQAFLKMDGEEIERNSKVLESYGANIQTESNQVKKWEIEKIVELFADASFDKLPDLINAIDYVSSGIFITNKDTKQKSSNNFIDELKQNLKKVTKEEEFINLKKGVVDDLIALYEKSMVGKEFALMLEINQAIKLADSKIVADGFSVCLNNIKLSSNILIAGSPKLQAAKIDMWMERILDSKPAQVGLYAQHINPAVMAIRKALPVFEKGDKGVKRAIDGLLDLIEVAVKAFQTTPEDMSNLSHTVQLMNKGIEKLRNAVFEVEKPKQQTQQPSTRTHQPSTGDNKSGGGSGDKSGETKTPVKTSKFG